MPLGGSLILPDVRLPTLAIVWRTGIADAIASKGS